jgi:hypothetical protein
LTELRELWLSGNELSGVLHPDIGYLQALTHFCVYDNQIGGSLPESIGKMHTLQYLSLGRNRLCGLVPPCLVGLVNLRSLTLYDNQFTGELPDWLFTMGVTLDSFALFENHGLEGRVPQTVRELRGMYRATPLSGSGSVGSLTEMY